MFRQIGQSALWIVTIQAMNFIVPLLALPQISRALHIQTFGIYSALISYGNYVLMFTDFSFYVNGPLRVADARRDEALKSLVLDSAALKCIVMVPVLIVFAAAAYRMDSRWGHVALAALIPLTTTFTPRWIMFSVGHLTSFAIGTALSKGLWLVSVYLLIHRPEDLGLLLFLTVAFQFAMCAACLGHHLACGERPPALSWARAVAIIRQDLRQFLAMMGTYGMRDLGIVLLSASAGPALVAVYSVADRVRFAIMGVVAPVSQSLFLITARLGSGEGGVKQRVRGITNIAILCSASLCGILVCALAGPIVRTLAGHQYLGAIPILRVLAFVPTFTGLNSILGVNTLLSNRLSDEYASTQLKALLVNAPVFLVLGLSFGAIGAACGVLFADMFTCTLLAITCHRHAVLKTAFAVR